MIVLACHYALQVELSDAIRNATLEQQALAAKHSDELKVLEADVASHFITASEQQALVERLQGELHSHRDDAAKALREEQEAAWRLQLDRNARESDVTALRVELADAQAVSATQTQLLRTANESALRLQEEFRGLGLAQMEEDSLDFDRSRRSLSVRNLARGVRTL